MVLDMETVLERQINGRSPSKVKELKLTAFKSKNITGISNDFINLETLFVGSAGLTSLAGLPKLPKLKTLNLENNQLNGEDLGRIVELCPKLEHLILKGNPITDFSSLEPLSKLTTLKELDLTDCEVAEGADFPTKLSELMPQLEDVKVAKNGDTEDDSEEEEGEEEVDGEDDEDEEEEESSDEEEETGKKKPRLSDLMKEMNDDDDDDEEFSGSEEEEEDDDEDDEDEEVDLEALKSPGQSPLKGRKRKAQDEEE